MNFSIILFLIGILGFILNRRNIILMIIAIEIMLLAVTLLVLISSFGFDDNAGQTFSIYIISIAGAESVIGLSILVAFYKFIASNFLNCYKFFSADVTALRGQTPDSSAPSESRQQQQMEPYNKTISLLRINKRCAAKQAFLRSLKVSRPYSSISADTFQLNKRLYSTNNISSYPLFITGLFDAEGSFVVTILKNPKLKTG